MPTYRYRATGPAEECVEGELDCSSLAEAISQLESKDLHIQSIELSTPGTPRDSGRSRSAAFPFASGTDPEHQQLKAHFDAVVAGKEQLIPALDALAKELPRGLARRELIRLIRVLSSARTGSDLSASSHATRWLPLLLSGLTQDAATHRLGDLLAIAARESRNRSERRRMLAYPAITLLITIIVFLLICGIIVPSFHSMFDDFGLVLPATTRSVLWVSELLTERLPSTLITIAIAGLVFLLLLRWWIGAAMTTRVFGFLVAGNASSVGAMASLISQLADLLSVGIALPDALWLAGEGCGHRFFQRAAEDLARHAYDSGQPLQSCSAAEKFPKNLVAALQAGPGGGPDLLLLQELGAMYADHATHRTNWTTGVVAQFSVLLIGIAVMYLVIALFAPIVSLVSGLS